MITYESLIPQLDAAVEQILLTQVTDASRHECGGFVGVDGLTNPSAVSTLSTLVYAYVLTESRHFRSADLLERIQLGAAFGRRVRRPSGCFDLYATNFDSAPDTAFTVQALAPAVAVARKMQDEGAARIAAEVGELVRTAVPGMIQGGFHTPNHRWVLVSALARAGKLFPELEVQPTIDAYLAEGIDINADGEYTERSTSVYNAVVNHALRLSAEALERPDLLEPVRRNLTLSYHLIHADGTVVTSISTRQDRGARVVPVALADSYYALARMDGNGFFAAVADWLCAQAGNASSCLPLFVDHPEWRQDDLEREELPTSYALTCPVSGLWRVRREQVSATAASGLTTPFSVKCGQAELIAVRLSSTYFATGQFVGEDFHEKQGRICLHHPGRNGIYPEREYMGGVYWLPVDERVNADNWSEVRGRRPTYQLPPLEVDLEIEEVSGGFDLRIRTGGGLDRVPFQIECVFAPGGELEMDGGVVQGAAGSTVLLSSGRGVYRMGTDAISVGPGEMRHQMWQMRNSETAPDSFRVLITLVTPVDRLLEIRCGSWSWGVGGLV